MRIGGQAILCIVVTFILISGSIFGAGAAPSGYVAPTITSLGGFGSPIVLGVPFKITINGTNFLPGARAFISGPGTTITSVNYINTTKIEIFVVYTVEASNSTQTIEVFNPGAAYSYTVGTLSASRPEIVSFGGFGAPIVLGKPFKITINGRNFQPGARVTISGPGTDIISTDYINTGAIEIQVVYTAAASDSTQTVTVTNPDGGSGSKSYTVGTLSASRPEIVSFGGFGAPIVLGKPFKITINGHNFQPDARVTISGPGASIGLTYYASVDMIVIYVIYTAAASNSTQTITVTNPDGGSGSKSYTVGTLGGD